MEKYFNTTFYEKLDKSNSDNSIFWGKTFNNKRNDFYDYLENEQEENNDFIKSYIDIDYNLSKTESLDFINGKIDFKFDLSDLNGFYFLKGKTIVAQFIHYYDYKLKSFSKKKIITKL